MATKKTSREKPKAKVAAKLQPGKLQNLAAKPVTFDDEDDSQLVDHSGVFRVTSAISQAQTGHADEEAGLRFASDSLVMAAQRDNFRDNGATIDDVVEERTVDDAAAAAERRARLSTLAARVQARNKTRR
ncbi:MAG: hypothetical protein HOV81_22965 [Kofleriaceae bacterium]|nr:hypothetical protein [Kofleriaceae bacterium]